MDSAHAILELIRLIKAFGNKSAKSLFSLNKRKTQWRILAQKFERSTRRNEGEWANELFGKNEHDQTYIRLRSELKIRLLNSLFHLDLNRGSEIRNAIYQNSKQIFFIRTLVMLGARNLAISLIPRALKRAEMFELTQDRIELLQFLRRNAAIDGDTSSVMKHIAELEEASQIQNIEMKLNATNDLISAALSRLANPNDKIKKLTVRAVTESEAAFLKVPSFNIGLIHYRLSLIESEISNNYQRTFDLCNEALKFLTQHRRLTSPLHFGEIAVKKLTSATSVRRYDEAFSAVQYCETFIPESKNNWFIWKGTEFVLLMHSKKWDAAEALSQRIINHSRFGNQAERVRQKWLIYHQYSSFLLTTGSPTLGKDQNKQFIKILRDSVVYKRDKEGYNAALIILQYLILAQRGDYIRLVRKSEAIRKYIQRYLRGKHDRQLFGFLRTLVILNQCDFHVANAEKRARKYIELFQTFGSDHVDETQILRFDHAWELIKQFSKH